MNKIEWFGELPSTWDVTRLKNVLIERNESNKPVKTDFILSLTNDRGVIPYSEKGAVGNNSKDDITGYKLAYPKDLVLNSMNVVIGSVGISKYFGCVSPVYYMLRPRNHEDPVEFYNYLFQTNEMQSALKGYGNGIMEIRMRIAMSKLNTFNLPIPSSQAQRKIVDRIRESENRIDQLIANQQQQIEKLKEYKQSLISEVVTKGLDPNVEFKDSGIEWIGKIPKYWNLSRIKDLLSIPLFYGSNKAGDLFNEDYPRYIRITDIQEDSLTTDISNMQSYLHSDYKKYLLQENDVLFARSGATSGKTYLVKHEDINNVFAGYLINGRFDQDKINPYFFNYYTKSSIWDMWKNYIFIQATIQNISAEKFNSFILSVPTIEDQNRIVDFLNTKMNKLDELIRLKKNKVAKLENFKKSLIYEYVTGMKEVS
ncbi:MAG: restriction endonuclease subunit S [Bacilli bacterium]